MSDRTFSFDGMTFALHEFKEHGRNVFAVVSDGKQITWPNLTQPTYERVHWDWHVTRVCSVEVRFAGRRIGYPDFQIVEVTKKVSSVAEIIGRLVDPNDIRQYHGLLGEPPEPPKRIKEMREMRCQWQPIETAPKDGTRILLASTFRVGESSYGLCQPQHDGYVANQNRPCWRSEDVGKMFPGIPLYWMALPPHPKELA